MPFAIPPPDPAPPPVPILLVDDNPVDLRYVEAVLARPDYRFVRAGGGREALACLERDDFAAVILDLQTADLDGFETATLARRAARSRETPILFVTAVSAAFPAEKAYELGAVDYLVKPLVPVIVRAKVAVFVDLYRKTERVRELERGGRVRAERALRQSEERYRLATAAAALGTWDFDPVTGRLEWDARCKELFGLPPDADVTYDTFLAGLHPDDRGRVHDLAGRARDPAGAGSFDAEYRTVGLADGGIERWVRATGRGYADGGRAVRFIGTVHDVTAEKRAADALTEADRRKDEFLATLAHELRNPLAPLRNGLQILRASGPRGPAADFALDTMDRQLRHMVRLINDLLDVSRVSRGVVDLKRERTDLAAVVRGAVEGCGSAADALGRTLAVDLPAAPVWVDGDPARLTQAVTNLLDNAIKYTDAGGRIGVTVCEAGGTARVAVRDSGIGIPADALPRVFDLFRQVDPSLSRSRGGLGVGLTLARRLVELHGGTVTGHSDGLGHGSEFVMKLPLNAGPTPEPPPPPPAASTPARRVLVIEDNRDGAETLRMLLELDGHEVAVAFDGPAGVSAARHFGPDVVVCDIGLPGLSGYDVARALRADPATAAARLVCVSGYGQAEDRRKAREAGFDETLVKPIDPTTLGLIVTGNTTI